LHILRGAKCEHVGNLTGQAKVTEFHRAILHQKYIVWLQVTMDETTFVHVFNASRHRPDNIENFL
jgi:hypothetical protein